MSTKAKLYLFDREFTILYFTSGMYTPTDYRGKPWGTPNGGLISVVIPCPQKPSEFLDAMIHDQMVTGKIQFWKWDGIHVGATLEFANAHIIERETNFYSDRARYNYTMRVVISPGIQRYRSTIFEKSWNPSNPFVESTTPVLTRESLQPQITRIAWVNADEQQEDITEIGSTQNASLVAEINNPQGTTVTVTIEKEDGTEFEKGKKQLSFTETISDDGQVEISPFEIKEAWEAFKTADVDKLIAKVAHNGVSKKSAALKLIPKPKVITYFRPNDTWKGEFGFDWIRMNDTKLFGDNKYENIVSKQYKDSAYTQLEKNSNVYKGYFKKDPTQFKKLKKKYNSFGIPWATTNAKGNKTPEDYLIPWMSMYKNQEVKIKTVVDIREKGDYLEFEDNPNFMITPKTIDISGKKGKIKPKDEITIKCLTEFAKDETIVIHACQKDANGKITKMVSGKITVWANDTTKQKEKKVVFVQIKTPSLSIGEGEKISDASDEKDRIERYLKQALIKLHPDSDIIDLDLSINKEFLNFITSSKVSSKNTKDKSALDTFLKKQLSDTFKKKYDNHFKAFYFAERGQGSTGGINGYSRNGSDFVVVFVTANNQTAAHEFLHALNLAHSFANSEASKHAKFTYQYAKTENLLDYTHRIPGHANDRCGLWYWQWVKANNSIK